MPSPNVGDSDSTAPVAPVVHPTSKDPRASETQGSGRSRANSQYSVHRSSTTRPRDENRRTGDSRSKGSRSDGEVDETPRTQGPPPPDKEKPKSSSKETKDTRTRNLERSDSQSSISSIEHTMPEEKSRKAHDTSARSSTLDDSRPPPEDRTNPASSNSQSQVASTTSRPPRGQPPRPTGEARSKATSTSTTDTQPETTKPSAQPPSQPPPRQGDVRSSPATSYAKVAQSTPRSTQSGPAHPRSHPPAPTESVEEMPSDLYAPDPQLPGDWQDMDVDELQQMQQVLYAQHANQGGDLFREGQNNNNTGYYGFGLGNAIRSLIPVGSPPPGGRDLYKAMGQIENLKMDLKRERGEFRHLRQAYLEADHERHRLKDNMRSLQHELENVHRELQEAKALSEIRGKELVGAQVFLTKADSLSISDVIEKVNILNEEIFQAAASLGETLVHVKRDLSEEEMQRRFNQACSMIGEPMVRLLLDQARRNEAEVNMLIVQAALSIFLVGFCMSKLDSWYPSDKDINAFLGTLYGEIRASEEQAVSGRWRALTRSKIRPTSENWKLELFEGLKNVLVISAWGSQNSRHQEVAFEQKLPPIFKAVEELRVALGEKFTSADLEVNVVAAKLQFDHRWMEDAYGDGRQAGGKQATEETVIGTVGIGLKKIVTDRTGKDAFQNFLSPKVVLESTLREALDPPPPTRRSKKRADPEAGNGGQESGNR